MMLLQAAMIIISLPNYGPTCQCGTPAVVSSNTKNLLGNVNTQE